ncbi:PQQ-binding-like beta-propeller repeat protein [Halobacteria archaeon HArc-gm2]|nr:PQQ-binding-like beta-propeller repeat protein [Halobacteria archaeon HArc-gm2]
MTRETRRSFARRVAAASTLLAGSGSVIGSAAAEAPCLPETERPAVQWRETFEVDSGKPMSFESPPAVTDDAVVVAGAAGASEFCPPAEATGNAIVSLARSSQERQWSYDVGMPVTRGIDVTGGTVLAGTVDRLLALDAADGSVQWQVDDGVSVAAAFVHDGDTVYAPVTGGSSSETSLVALDVASGTERWRFDGSDGALSTIDDLAIGDGQVYVEAETDGEDAVIAVEAATGRRNWSVTGRHRGLVGSEAGYVFTSDMGESFSQPVLASWDPSDGSEVWRTGIDRGIHEVGVASSDDTVYVPNVGFDTNHRGVEAVAFDDGAERWSNPLNEFERDVSGATMDPYASHTARPALANGTLYLSYERYVVALDPSDGTVLNYYEGETDLGGVAARDDAVYATDEGGRLTAIDPLP